MRALVVAVLAVLTMTGAAPAAATAWDAGPPEFPIQCLDGSTVEFGDFCPLPEIQCADGSSVPLGQFCQPAPPQGDPDARAPRSTTCPDGSIVRVGQSCPSPAPQPQPAPRSIPADCHAPPGGGYLCKCPSGEFSELHGSDCYVPGNYNTYPAPRSWRPTGDLSVIRPLGASG